jgi:hypothetical protein
MMPTPLSWYPRPKVDTGLGLHDSSNVGANPPDFEAHAKALRAAGISWYKILEAGNNKIERCRVYLEHDIMPIVRLYQHRPHPDYIVYPGQVAAYVAAGVRYFEMGNEPNISPDEWKEGKWPDSANDLGRIVAEQWLKAADMVKREGGIPLVYAWTPGGTYDHAGGHRRFTIDFLSHLALGALEGAGVAIHPRPHNNPPDAAPTSTNTVTFREHEWYAQTYKELIGWIPPMFATEHGYSIGDSQNANFPRIDEHLWTEYNQELFERMNPNHPKAIPSHLFTLCYWLETEGGDWPNDQLSNGWYPDGLRMWGQRLASMRVTWNRTIQAAPAPTPQPTPTPKPEVPAVTDRLVQILQAKLGNRFKDIRSEMRKGAGSYDYVDSRKMPYIALHYSTGLPGPVSPWNIADFHAKPVAQGGRGWPGIGYHFVIDEGLVYYVGSVDTQRAHIANRNDEALGVCFTGIYDKSLPAMPDVEACKLLTAGLDEFYEHKKEIHGHNWFMPAGHTACPGRIVEIIPSLRAATPPPAPVAPVDSFVGIAKDKSMQLISPNWDAAIAKAAVKAGYTAPLGNEITLKEWVFQLWGKPGSKTEAVFYVLKGDWGNVKSKAL